MLLNRDVIDILDLSEKAVEILEESDRKIQFQLRKHTPGGEIVFCYVVYHSTARGPPCKGGIRMSKDVSMEKTEQLAEIMTYKSSLMGLPFGGGKSGIAVSRNLSPEKKSIVMSGYTHEIREELYSGAYVPAPDFGTGPREMAEIFDETHVRATVTGKPVGVGGLPGRKEATGYGVMTATKRGAYEFLNSELSDLTVAVQGFGNVGYWTSKFLAEEGAKIVGVTDAGGGAFNEDGLRIGEMKKHEREKGTVNGFTEEEITNEELFELDVDVLIPAAIGGAVTEEVAEGLRADLIVEGANAPTTGEGDEVLKSREIPVVPDILANAGGVVASYVEWRGGKSGSKTKKEETYQIIEENINEAFEETLKASSEENVGLRDSAMVVAAQKLKETMKGRGWI